MSNPLYRQLMPQINNPLLNQLMSFKNSFSGDPQQIIQSMLNSGRISQAQINQYAEQANQIYRMLNGMK